jgi:dUTP pyrophosphatase
MNNEIVIPADGIELNNGMLEVKCLVRYKKLNDLAKEPTRGSAAAAGYDLYAASSEPITIPAHQTIKVGTGLAFELPDSTFGAIFARSGLATKKGLRPANCIGVCDSDYRGEYIVVLHNDTNIDQTIDPQERIAQLVLLPYIPIIFEEVQELENTERGQSGFGSTGTN